MTKRLAPALAAGALLLLAAAAGAQTPQTAPPAVPAAGAPGSSAPAAAEPLPDWLQYRAPYVGEQSDQSQPHRTVSEINEWTQDKVADALSFTPAEIDIKLREIKPYFNDRGWRDYAGYMQSAKILDMVKKHGFTVTTIINGDTRVISQGAVAGAYRWLVEMPAIISFSRYDAQGNEQSMGGGTFRLTAQVGRTTGDVMKDGLVIESFKSETISAR